MMTSKVMSNAHQNGLSLVNGSRTDRKRFENGAMKFDKLFAVLVMLLCLGVGQVWGTTFTTTNSGGFSGTNMSKAIDGITVTFSSDASWQSGHVRVYQNGTISFSCSSNITAITINCTSTSDYPARTFNASTGSCAVDGSAITWSGSGTSFTLTLPSGKQIRITSIEVTTGSSCSTPPTVGASSNSSISVTGATVSCTGITKGDCDIDEWGFFYKTGSSGVTTSDTKVQVSAAKSTTNVSSFNKSFTELNPNTHYYFKAYAKVGSNYYLSSETDFTTKTLTSTSSNTTYGTVSRSGRVITGSLKSGGVYSSPAYTVTGASDGSTTTVSRVGNTFTVTSNSTSNITVRINFEAKGCEDKGASSITSTSGGNSCDYGPVDSYYKYSTRQILYTKSDLGLSSSTKKGTIKSIYFYYKHTTAMSSKTDVKIYMANTYLTSLSTSDYVPYSEFTLVYSGPLNCTATNSWNEFFLDTPFEYNGAGNLVVMIDDDSYAYDGSSYTFYYPSASGAQIYKRSDSSNENPATTDWSTYTAASYRPSTKFCIAEADMEEYTVNWYVNGTVEHSQTGYAGTTLTGIPTPDASDCDGSKVFVGWTTSSSYSHASTPPTFVSPTKLPDGGANYYAVFANSASSSKTYEASIERSHVPASYGGALSSVTATETGGGSGTFTVSLNGSNVMQGTGGNNTKIQFRKTSDGAGTIYNTTDLGTINSVTTNNSDIKYYINSAENPSSAGSGGYFRVYNNVDGARYSSSVVVNFTKTTYTYTNYATSCCTALGSINGSVNLTYP